MEFAPLVKNPWLWIYLCGLLLGAAGGSLLRVRKRHRSPITIVSLLAAASLACLSLGFILVPGFLATHGLAWGFAASLITGVLLGRFPVPIGSLLFVVLLVIYSAVGIRVRPLRERDISTDSLNISILRLFEEGGGSIEVRCKGETSVVRLGVDKFLLQGTVYSISAYIPWPGSDLVIPERVVASEGGEVLYVLPSENREEHDSRLSEISEQLSRLALIGTEEWSSPVLRLRLFTGYKITVEDGKIQTAPLSFQ